MAWVQSLAWELLHAADAAKKERKKEGEGGRKKERKGKDRKERKR